MTAAAQAFEDDPTVEFAEPNNISHLTATFPNDPRFGDLGSAGHLGRRPRHRRARGLGPEHGQRQRHRRDRQRRLLRIPTSPRTSGSITTPRTGSTTTATARSTTPAAGTSSNRTTPARLQRPRHACRGHDRRAGQQRPRRHRRQLGRDDHANPRGRCLRQPHGRDHRVVHQLRLPKWRRYRKRELRWRTIESGSFQRDQVGRVPIRCSCSLPGTVTTTVMA